ncbi:thiolase family protein [Sulfurimonas sp.]|jgi:acetyl-CoA acetyltransferase family protein|uniref:thiolase family protein n=1 Tax=Sulfurimonas sp. TaxID=2022749 RepID=UPI0025F1B7A8|nr:thiolase family protein [Sulfurimonas sp.]
MKERIAIIDGLRTPVAKAGGKLKNIQAESLGSFILNELALRVGLDLDMYDEIIIGNVSQPGHAANIARVISLKAGFPEATPAYTVHRNCASGMESITSAAEKILAGRGEIYMAGGVESMSNIPLMFNKKMSALFEALFKSRTPLQKIKTLSTFTPSHLKPIIGLMQGLTDPLSGLMMGSTAEILAQDFGISRKEQDEFSVLSHQKAEASQKNKIFEDEIAPIVYDTVKGLIMCDDDGIRYGQNMQALTKLKPFFDKKNGTVTAGNSSQVSDAAAAVVLMSESKAKELGLKPLGFLREYTYAGLDPTRMGLGPAYSTAKILEMTKMQMSDFELIELNEAFASQVLANLAVFESQKYASAHLNRTTALGSIDTNILNINGGGIALGHPVGMTGTRLVIHTLKELRRQNKNIGLATLCIGGGQGASMILEVE